tara:strand:- start:107 stop:763 length:657 start_codon:yes stop_codon:yes gene_type:complete
MKTFVQIGTHNGNDEFSTIVAKENPDLVVLIEPNSSLNEQIIQNYSYLSEQIDKDIKFVLENIAITTESGPCKLVIPKNEVVFSNGHRHRYTDVNFSLLPMDDWGEEFDTIEVDGITFNQLCEKYSINEIDYLQIDVEGFDSQIILSIDFDKIKINKIKYEIWGFDPSESYTRYGKDGEKYGSFGMKEVEKKLTTLGYNLIPVPNYSPTDIEATLTNV